MKFLAGLGAVGMLAALTACETTGNPREGGLFGWSENKARERQAQRQSRNAGTEASLAREQANSRTLESREAATSRQLSEAQAKRAREEKQLHAKQARLVAKAEKLEAESTTDSAASRARAYRREVDTIVAQVWQTPQQRSESLDFLEAKIDTALARLKQARPR